MESDAVLKFLFRTDTVVTEGMCLRLCDLGTHEVSIEKRILARTLRVIPHVSLLSWFLYKATFVLGDYICYMFSMAFVVRFSPSFCVSPFISSEGVTYFPLALASSMLFLSARRWWSCKFNSGSAALISL